MLKRLVSVLILSALFVSLFGVVAFADVETCPYSDTSIIPVSREEFFEVYAPNLNIPENRINIPEDDYIFLVRNTFGDYDELIRDYETGRLIRIYEICINLDNDVQVDYKTMNTIGFYSNPMGLSLSRPKFNNIGTNITGAFAVFDKEDNCYPTENTSCSEPIVTEFFLFTKSENFSAIVSATCDIITTRGVGVPVSELHASLISDSYDYIKPLKIMTDGNISDYIAVGEGSDTYMATFLDNDGKVLWETFVPVGLKAPKVLLKLEEKTTIDGKHIFSGWRGFTDDVLTQDMTYTAEYTIIPDERGDINNDGSVNTRDVVMLIKELEKSSVSLLKERADVNLDGVINFDDVTYMLETLAEAREW